MQVLPNDSVRISDETSLLITDIESVYTIVFFEKSESIFHAFPEDYLHFFSQQSDTGLQMNLLQKYYFIPLDIFRKNIHNLILLRVYYI